MDTLKINDMIKFLIKAKKVTYAGDGTTINSSRLGASELKYEEDKYEYHDSYYGIDPFVGEEVVRSNGKVVWAMNYMGRKLDKAFDYKILKEALILVSKEKPFRGPERFSNEDFNYANSTNGTFEWFQGYETIECRGKLVYECYYHGGIVR